jgi:hypothetical protein
MPTTAAHTYSCDKLIPYSHPQDARMEATAFGANLTLAKGTVLGQVTATGLFAAYNDANANGTEVANRILPYAIRTDANGKITLGDVSTGNEHGEKYDTIPCYTAGEFLESELVGLDANGLADLRGRYLSNVATKKVIRIG